MGFLRRLELRRRPADGFEAQLGLLRHPSVRLVQELRLAFESASDAARLARLAEAAPRAVRRLELAIEGDAPMPELPVSWRRCRGRGARARGARELRAAGAPAAQRLSLGRGRRLGEPALAVGGLRRWRCRRWCRCRSWAARSTSSTSARGGAPPTRRPGRSRSSRGRRSRSPRRSRPLSVGRCRRTGCSATTSTRSARCSRPAGSERSRTSRSRAAR